jgi:hypothetical protein
VQLSLNISNNCVVKKLYYIYNIHKGTAKKGPPSLKIVVESDRRKVAQVASIFPKILCVSAKHQTGLVIDLKCGSLHISETFMSSFQVIFIEAHRQILIL